MPRVYRLEKQLEKEVSKRVRKAGGLSYKFVSPAQAGVPDRILILPGYGPWFVELKRAGEAPTKLQMHVMQEMAKRGCDVGWYDNVEDFQRALDKRVEEGAA